MLLDRYHSILVKYLPVLFFGIICVSQSLHAQVEESVPEETQETQASDISTDAVPEEYEWYQYEPGDSASKDTSLPKLPVWSFGLRAGNAGYLGDLNNQQLNPFFGGFHPGIGLMASRHLSRMFETSLEFHYIGLGGGDGTRNFTANGLEFTGNITLNITRSFSTALALKRKLNLYAFFGTGFNFFNATISGGTESIAPVKSTELVLVTGFTAGYRISPKIEAGLVFSYRYVNSDRLDALASPYTGNDGYTLLGLMARFQIAKTSQKEEDIVARLRKEMLAYMTKDSDEDGVPDYLDKDNNTAPGLEVGSRGMVLDTDGDGIADALDADPFTPPGTPVDANGMPSDRDGDGVPDYRDSEPDSGEKQIVNFQGKTIVKKEKHKPEPVSGADSDLIKRVLSAWNLSLIRFSPGSYLVSEKYYQGLSELAFMMQAQPDMRARVIGHTDTQGSQNQNEKLALNRAQEIVRIMHEVYGIEKNRFVAEAAVDKQPLNQGTLAPKDPGANRRAEIRILLKGVEIK